MGENGQKTCCHRPLPLPAASRSRVMISSFREQRRARLFNQLSRSPRGVYLISSLPVYVAYLDLYHSISIAVSFSSIYVILCHHVSESAYAAPLPALHSSFFIHRCDARYLQPLRAPSRRGYEMRYRASFCGIFIISSCLLLSNLLIIFNFFFFSEKLEVTHGYWALPSFQFRCFNPGSLIRVMRRYLIFFSCYRFCFICLIS